jgi:hypothetical protein
MFEAIFTLVGAALAVLFLIGGLCTFFYQYGAYVQVI